MHVFLSCERVNYRELHDLHEMVVFGEYLPDRVPFHRGDKEGVPEMEPDIGVYLVGPVRGTPWLRDVPGPGTRSVRQMEHPRYQIAPV